MILAPADLPVPVLDTTALHVQALLDAALDQRISHERGAA